MGADLPAMVLVERRRVDDVRQLTEKELDHVSGGAISDNFVTVNGGGNTPQGNANGIAPTYINSTNPAGNVPPGQQLT
jgi:bacteriocin-like protein